MTLPDSECTVAGLIRSKAARDPERVFIAKDAARLSYGEAERRSRKLARGLLAAGVGKGTRVALLLPNGPDWVLAWLAAARIGALVVPLNTFYQARELGFVLRHADVHMLLTSGALPEQRLPRAAREVRARARGARRRARCACARCRTCARCASGRATAASGPWTSGGAAALEALADATPGDRRRAARRGRARGAARPTRWS